MRDTLDYLNALAVRARCERAPRVDVSGKVLRQLSARPEVRVDTQMGALALASAFAAAFTIVLTVWNSMAAPDPIESMIEVSSLLGL